LSAHSQAEGKAVQASQPAGQRKAGDKVQTIQACNFRSAGRMSNENARALTALYETFARHLASALDAYLGTGLEVKLKSLDQLPIKEHITGIAPLSYIVPLSLSTAASTLIVEFDLDVVFPIIELLLGGTGEPQNVVRELSEIEEEIMQDVMTLIARQAEQGWNLPAMSLVAGNHIKSSLLHRYCPANEKVTLAKFEIELAGTTGSFQLVFPTSFINVLLNQIKLDQPQKKGALRYFPVRSIRERIVDCDVVVSASLPHMKVTVRDLIALQPGCVLKLRAPVQTPGMLTIEGHQIFEAVPVRNGARKAAQLGRRTQPAN
jgi:flagellar motor switch protein FliM